jgi:IMP dehydrogenase/GMP reductase
MSLFSDKILYEGLTFDDVLLVPSYSEVLPRDVNISSMFSRNIRINTPLVSAAMDSVAEDDLAISISREGGIGVIHKNMTIEKQAAQVKRFKRDEFAGVEESPGETIFYNGRKFKAYRGMGSIEAMQQGSKDRYFQDMEDDIRKLVPEGIAARVPYKGTLAEVIYQMTGGLRAGMGYVGAINIESLKKEARFVRVTNSGIIESHPHDVSITRESPNYSRKSLE